MFFYGILKSLQIFYRNSKLTSYRTVTRKKSPMLNVSST